MIKQILIAVLINLVLGKLLIEPVIKKARNYIGDQTRYPKIANWIGIVERLLYILAWFLGHPEFLGIWLIFKIASTWNRWGGNEKQDKGSEKEEEDSRARGRFNIFVLGNALSILVVAISILLVTIYFKPSSTFSL